MNHFFAYLDRMKLIRRWGLMRNTVPENDMEHSLQTALIAHGISVLARVRYGREVDPERVVMIALYHDASEIITGDLPTPVKYKNPSIQDAYGEVEAHAREQLLDMLPNDMRPYFVNYVKPDESTYEWRIVKAADRISAYLKCIEEEKMGNRDFAHAKTSVLQSITMIDLPEVQAFMAEFVASFSLSPDELSR